ncbi:sulfite exporter TauE/SafE family protein [Bifidobacterium sp. UBA744]|uniref:sulfite exporter TauE/SafE family protein n=1 Tax=Bifidobacterium sp. UBA744 TaxID=1946112 RepID=UPI0025BE694D|nr:sulfite exporter TauE/SafE family protein [Bifidobacterium sp. UBA744]
MTIWQFVALVAAGVGAGFVGYSVGLASLISFPATLAVGVPPVMASATNTAGNVGIVIGGCLGARPELRRRRHVALVYAVIGLVGGVIGALLLLTLPARFFEYSVPPMLALSALLILARPRKTAAGSDGAPARAGGSADAGGSASRRGSAGRPERDGRRGDPGETIPMVAAMSALSVYSGYFGAGSGTATLAVLSVGKVGPYAEINALKTLGCGMANISATIMFVITGVVHWPAMAALFIGSVVGSRFAPAVVRRVPERLMRILACVSGIVLAVYLGIRYY